MHFYFKYFNMEEKKEKHFNEDEKSPTSDPGPKARSEQEESTGSVEKESPVSAKDIPLEIVSGDEDFINTFTSDDIRGFNKQLTQLGHKLAQLNDEFQSKLKYDSHKEKIIDNLHAELQVHKNGLMGKLLRPVFMDIIELTDDIRRLLKDMALKGEADNVEKLKKFFAAVPDDLEDLLYKHGVEVVKSREEAFDPSSQKVIKTLPTEQEELDKTVCERLKNGYSWEGKLLRHEIVNVWQYRKPTE